MSEPDVLPRFRRDGDAPLELDMPDANSSNVVSPSSNSAMARARDSRLPCLPEISDRNRPWVILGVVCIMVAAVVVVFEPSLWLGMLCTLTWLFAELSMLPAVVKANSRGKLDPGENAYPWMQNWVASLARVPYYVNPEAKLPFLVALSGFFALGASTYTGFVALRISHGSEFNWMALMSWFGVMSMAFLQWHGSLQIQGIFFIALIGVKNLSVLAKISYALKHRDPKKFSDGKMLTFNMVNAFIWLVYTYTIPDYVLVANNAIVILCVLPCLILKIVLHPKLLGKSKQSTPNFKNAAIRKASGPQRTLELSNNDKTDDTANRNPQLTVPKLRRGASAENQSKAEQKSANEASGLRSSFPAHLMKAAMALEDVSDSNSSLSSKGLLSNEKSTNPLPSDFFDPPPDLGNGSVAAPSTPRKLPTTFPQFTEAASGDSVTELIPRGTTSNPTTTAPLPSNFFDPDPESGQEGSI
jgi:hypothetical protein